MAVLEESIRCPYCNESVGKSQFCSSCGAPLPEKEYIINPVTDGHFSLDLGSILQDIYLNPCTPEPYDITTALGNTLTIKPILTNQQFVRHAVTHYNIERRTSCSLSNYTVVDFETANMYPDSICQIGMAVVENNEIVQTKSYFIRPPYNDFRNSVLHGITLDTVKTAPSFDELWETLKPDIENRLIGAYNARFDIGCFDATLQFFGIDFPDFAYFDILQNAREKWGHDFPNLKLNTLTKALGIQHSAHDAASDAVAAAKVQMMCELTDTPSHMFVKNNNHEEVMENLMPGWFFLDKAIRLTDTITSTDINDYFPALSLYAKALERNADRAKILRKYGEILEQCNEERAALERYIQAYELNSRIGVKGKIIKLAKKLSVPSPFN